MDADDLLRLLIAHPSSHEAEGLLNVLRRAGYATRPAYISSSADISPTLDKGVWDLVLTAPALEDGDLSQLMTLFTAAQKDLPVLVIGDDAGEEAVVEALQLGARDFILRERPGHLLEAVRRELGALAQRRERRLCESTLREHQRRSSALLAASRHAVAYVLDGMHIHANDHYARVFGLEDPTHLAQVPMMDLIDGADRPGFRDLLRAVGRGGESADGAMEVTAIRGDGTPFPALFTITHSVYEGEACLQVVVASLEPADADTERYATAPSRPALPAAHPLDSLLQMLEERVSAAIREQRRAFLLLGELDRYMELKRRLGPVEAHQLMGEVTAELERELGEQLPVLRVGDATFAVVADDSDLPGAAALAERVRRTVAVVRSVERGHAFEVTCSIGMAAITELTPSAQTAFGWAVAACQRAVAAGGNRFFLHEAPERGAEKDRSEGLGKAIKRLLKRKRDVLSYRPIVGLHGPRREFYEVIPQLADEDGKPYATDEVYRAFEVAGLSREFDQWMLERVVDLARSIAASGRDIYFILGLSDHAMVDESRVLSVAKALKGAGLDGRRLIFRVSETAASTNLRLARSFAKGLHELNCGLMLTHYGSGLTPFRILEHLDADYLAFDAAFVQDIARNPQSREAVEALCAQAGERSKLTLAPGVRDADTLAVLWRCGVDYASGDYLQEAGPEMTYDFQAEA